MAHKKMQKIRPGKKYSRIQRFPTLGRGQKKILKKFERHVKPGKFKTPKMMKKGLSFLQKGMLKGPGKSPLEATGTTFLQNLLGRTPEEQLGAFEAPYLRQFHEEIAPEIAERFAGADAIRSSGFQNAIMGAGAGLSENLASLKANLINQLLGQQTQAANVGLGYAQLPGQRFGEQLQAAQLGIPYSMAPQEQQNQLNQFAANQQYQQRMGALGMPRFGMMDIPAQPRRPGIGAAMPGIIGGAIQGGIGGFMAGGPVGAGIGAIGGGLGGYAQSRAGGGPGGAAPSAMPMFGGGGGGGGMGAARRNIYAPEAAPGFYL